MDSTPTINVRDTKTGDRNLNSALRRAAQTVASRSPSSRSQSSAASPSVADASFSRRSRTNAPLPRYEQAAAAKVTQTAPAVAAPSTAARAESPSLRLKAVVADEARTKVRPLFRADSVRHASASESMDTMFRATRPMNWLILFAIIGLIAAAVFWAFFGSVSTRIGGRGILIKPGGVDTLAATHAGQLLRLRVSPGDRVRKGQVIAEVADATIDGPPIVSRIHAASDGRVLQALVKNGAQVTVGTPLLTVEAADSEGAPLQALLYVPLADATRLRTQMSVHLSPSDFHKEEFGYVLGRVKSIGEFPVTRQEAEGALSNPELVDSLLSDGPMLAVLVDLVPDRDSPSGYKWSSGKGPKGSLSRGTLCSALVTVQRQHPAELVIPGMKQVSGLADNPS